MRKRLVWSVVIAASALGAGSLAFAGGKTTLNLTADKIRFAYNKKTLTAKTGKITIVMKNPSAVFQHDIAIKGHGVKAKGKVVGKGGTSTVTAALKPGVYEFYCTVPGHEAGGMKGKLIVTK